MVCIACAKNNGADVVHFQPHEGPQSKVLREGHAQVNVIGGARGGGKSRVSLYRPQSYRPRLPDPRKPGVPAGWIQPVFEDPRFVGMIFRREAERLRKKGAIWDECKDVYGPLGAKLNNNEMSVTFPSGARIQCAGIEHEKDVEKYRGAAFTWILIEEAPEFTQDMIDALLRCSRPISRSKTVPWVDVTTNPDPDSWVFDYVRRFLDADGYPDPELCEKTLWVSPEDGDDLVWVDELFDADPELAAEFDRDPRKFYRLDGDVKVPAMSVRFFPSRVDDNPTIVEVDPSYVAKLSRQAAHIVDRDRRGGWLARPDVNSFSDVRFHYVQPQDVPIAVWQRAIRYWDLAATPKTAHRKPDASAGVLTASIPCPECEGWRFDNATGEPCALCNTRDLIDVDHAVPIVDAGDIPTKADDLERTFWILDIEIVQALPTDVQAHVRRVALRDGINVPVYFEEELGGAAGKYASANFDEIILPEFEVVGDRPGAGKEARGDMWSGAAKRGQVFVVIAPWNMLLQTAMRMFPKKGKNGERDAIDGVSGGFGAHLIHEWKSTAGDGWSFAVTPRRGAR